MNAMDEIAVPFHGYDQFLQDLRARIRTAQVRAGLAVNRELVLLYWSIGRDILARQQEYGWGARVIDRLAADLQQAFPETKGFSPRNLKYMRALAEAYPNESFVQQVVAQIPSCRFGAGREAAFGRLLLFLEYSQSGL